MGVFSIIGASIAYSNRRLSFLPMLFAGVLTAIGGGILRDVLLEKSQLYLSKKYMLLLVLLESQSFYVVLSSGIDIQVASIIGIVSATGIRLLAMKYNWNLPKAKGTAD